MASIPYPKSWVAGEILKASDLNAQFAAVVSISGIAGSQLANGAIGPTQLAVDSVTAAAIAASAVGTSEIAAAAVTSPKLADGATAIQVANAAIAGVTPIGNQTSILPAVITMTRTRVRIVVSWNGHLDSGAALNDPITVELLRGATVIATVTSRIAVPASGYIIPVSGCIPFVDNPGPGTYTYLLRMTITGGSQTTTINAQMMIEEVA